jgi:hypothetical protein
MVTRRKVSGDKLSDEVIRDVAVSGVKLRQRHDGWTEERQRRFLQALAMTGCVRDACRVAGMSNVAGYRLRKVSPEFREAWDRALDHAKVGLKAVAYARAVEGVEEPIIQGGKVVATKRKYSDSLLRMLMQASDPEAFGRIGGGMCVQAREAIEKEAYERGRADEEAERRARAEATYKERYAKLWTKLSEMNRRMGGPG